MQKKTVLLECSIMRAVAGHPVCVRFLDCFRLDAASFGIAMELVHGGELYELVMTHGALREPQARHVMSQLLDALRCVLHAHHDVACITCCCAALARAHTAFAAFVAGTCTHAASATVT
jgi:serine/threonine protein kinase